MAILVLVTTSNSKEARFITDDIITKRLAACVNIIDNVHSIYLWKDSKEQSKETLLLIKTKEDILKELINRIKKIHSYVNPEIIALPIIDGSEDYLNWIGEETK
jgi:periplasmic divalent cation tolerance protein|tara:strand:+ start:562 stop:873 length:312 start_codon:yes stop_codon:yes gene_type:complete